MSLLEMGLLALGSGAFQLAYADFRSTPPSAASVRAVAFEQPHTMLGAVETSPPSESPSATAAPVARAPGPPRVRRPLPSPRPRPLQANAASGAPAPAPASTPATRVQARAFQPIKTETAADVLGADHESTRPCPSEADEDEYEIHEGVAERWRKHRVRYDPTNDPGERTILSWPRAEQEDVVFHVYTVTGRHLGIADGNSFVHLRKRGDPRCYQVRAYRGGYVAGAPREICIPRRASSC